MHVFNHVVLSFILQYPVHDFMAVVLFSIQSMNKQLFSHQNLPRQPLSSLSTNIQFMTSNPPPSFTPLLTITNHHRPCPQCQSPAKELNLRRAECSKCTLDFCLHCFDHWHEGECPIRSPKRPAAIAGTIMCKKRLRRL